MTYQTNYSSSNICYLFIQAYKTRIPHTRHSRKEKNNFLSRSKPVENKLSYIVFAGVSVFKFKCVEVWNNKNLSQL